MLHAQRQKKKQKKQKRKKEKPFPLLTPENLHNLFRQNTFCSTLTLTIKHKNIIFTAITHLHSESESFSCAAGGTVR